MYLATLYLTVGRFADAMPLLQSALTVQEKTLGPDHLLVAIVLDGLAESAYRRRTLCRRRTVI